MLGSIRSGPESLARSDEPDSETIEFGVDLSGSGPESSGTVHLDDEATESEDMIPEVGTSSTAFPQTGDEVEDENKQKKSVSSSYRVAADHIPCVLKNKDLNRYRIRYKIPSSINLRLPLNNERASNFKSGEVPFYEQFFAAGLRLPLQPVIRRLLADLKLCPAQLAPNCWRDLLGAVVLWRSKGWEVTADELRYCMYLKTNPKPNNGWVYFPSRKNRKLLFGNPSSVHEWKGKFFFVSGEWELCPDEDRDVSVPTFWGRPDFKGSHVIPKLSPELLERVDTILSIPDRTRKHLLSSSFLAENYYKFQYKESISIPSDVEEESAGEEEDMSTPLSQAEVRKAWRKKQIEASGSVPSTPSKKRKVSEVLSPDSRVPSSPAKQLVLALSAEHQGKGKGKGKGSIPDQAKVAVSDTSEKDKDRESTKLKAKAWVLNGISEEDSLLASSEQAYTAMQGLILPVDSAKIKGMSTGELITTLIHNATKTSLFSHGLSIRLAAEVQRLNETEEKSTNQVQEITELNKRVMALEEQAIRNFETLEKSRTLLVEHDKTHKAEMEKLKQELEKVKGELDVAGQKAVKDFKSSNEYKDELLSRAADQFGVGFESCRKAVLKRFPDLNLAGLEEEEEEEEGEAEAGTIDMTKTTMQSRQPIKPR